MYIILLKCFVVLLLGVVVFSILGKAILALIGVKPFQSSYSNFAISQIVGISFCTIATALFISKGVTILSLLIVIFILIFYELRKGTTLDFSANYVTRFRRLFTIKSHLFYIEIFALLSILFMWQAFTFIDFKSGILITSNADLHIVSFAANTMMSSGIERNFVYDTPANILAPTSPYHYFEYWFIILFTKVNSNTPLFSLKLHLIPLFMTVLYALTCMLAECLKVRVSFAVKLLAAGMVFIIPPAVLLRDNVFLARDIANDAMLFKSIHLTWIVLLGLIALVKGEKILAGIIILSFPVVCYTSVPIIFPTIIFVSALGTVSKMMNIRNPAFLGRIYRDVSRNALLALLIYAVVILASLIFFYSITSSIMPKSPLIPYLYADEYGLASVLHHLKIDLVADFLESLLPLAGLLFLVIVLYYMTIKINGKNVDDFEVFFLLMFSIQFCFAALFSVLFYYNFDHFVIYRVTNLPFIYILLVFLALRWYRDYQQFGYVKYLALLVLLLNIIFSMYSDLSFYNRRREYSSGEGESVYRQKVLTLVKRAKSVGVFMKGEGLITNSNANGEYDIHFTETHILQRLFHPVYRLGMFLDYYVPDVVIHPITLTPHTDSTLDRDYKENTMKIDNMNKSYFYSIYCKKVLKDSTLSENEKRISFIKYTNASFLIASKYANIDPRIYHLFIDSAINARDGERFYLLSARP